MILAIVVLLAAVFFLAVAVANLIAESSQLPWGAEAAARRALQRRRSALMAELMGRGINESDASLVVREALDRESADAMKAYVEEMRAAGDA